MARPQELRGNIRVFCRIRPSAFETTQPAGRFPVRGAPEQRLQVRLSPFGSLSPYQAAQWCKSCES
jgi:hypothetical protein